MHMCEEMRQRASELRKECDARDFTCSFVKFPDLHITWNDLNMRIWLGHGPEITDATITTKRDASEAEEGSRESIPSKIKDNFSVLNSTPTHKRYYVNLIEKITLRESTDIKNPFLHPSPGLTKKILRLLIRQTIKSKYFISQMEHVCLV